MEEKETELEAEKSNTADNAGITHSQVHDTHRRMQEVNSSFTDGGPLSAEYCIVTFHTIQPSSLVCKEHSQMFRLGCLNKHSFTECRQ